MDDVKTASSWRLTAYPLVVLITLLGALVFSTVRYNSDDVTLRIGGDYPAFYGAGSIAADGDWDELYSAERQQAAQTRLVDDEGGYLYFSYPPVVAAAYGPLAALPYEWSFLLHTILMAAALALAVWALEPWLKGLGLPRMALLVAALAFYPVFRAVSGGQNTALTLLLLAAALRFDHEDRPVPAGLIASLVLFKPQFGILVLPLLLVGRRWRMAAAWSGGAAALYACSVFLMGGGWLSEWWQQARQFGDQNLDANGANFVSLPGFLGNALGSGASAVGYVLAVIVGVVVAYLWWRTPHYDAPTRWAALAAAMVVVAPQTLYYDVGLLLIPVVWSLRRWPATWAIGAAVVTWTQIASSQLGWSPLGPVVIVAVTVLLALQVRREGVDADPESG